MSNAFVALLSPNMPISDSLSYYQLLNYNLRLTYTQADQNVGLLHVSIANIISKQDRIDATLLSILIHSFIDTFFTSSNPRRPSERRIPSPCHL